MSASDHLNPEQFDYGTLLKQKKDLHASSYSDSTLIHYANLHTGKPSTYEHDRWSAASALVEHGWTRDKLKSAHS